MYTVRDLVTEAATDCGVVAIGNPLSAEEAANGVRTLNRILDAYALDGLTAPGLRTLSVDYPAGAEFVEFRRGVDDGSWPSYAVGVPEVPARPSVVVNVCPAFRDPLPFMDADSYYSRETVGPGAVDAWHWEDNQYPRLFLVDPPAQETALQLTALCDPYRDVDLNTDLTNWRVGLRPLLVAELSAELARQNGIPSGAGVQAARLKLLYRRSVRPRVSMRMDRSAPGVQGEAFDIKKGNF